MIGQGTTFAENSAIGHPEEPPPKTNPVGTGPSVAHVGAVDAAAHGDSALLLRSSTPVGAAPISVALVEL